MTFLILDILFRIQFWGLLQADFNSIFSDFCIVSLLIQLGFEPRTFYYFEMFDIFWKRGRILSISEGMQMFLGSNPAEERPNFVFSQKFTQKIVKKLTWVPQQKAFPLLHLHVCPLFWHCLVVAGLVGGYWNLAL